MPTYPAGRYHWDAASRYWRSGPYTGPFQPLPPLPPDALLSMRGGRLTSPGAPTLPPDDFVLGTTKPSAAYAGLPAGWAPARTVTTAQVFSGPGQLVEDVQFDCNVDFQSTGWTFNRCHFRGAPNMGVRPALNHVHPGLNTGPANVFNRCRISPQNKIDGADCIMGYNYTLNRCEMTGGGDGSGSYIPPTVGTDLRITRTGNWTHDLLYFCPSTGHSDGHSHNDGDQHHNGIGLSVVGDFVDAFWDPTIGVGATAPGVFHMVGNSKVWDSGNCNSAGVANGPLHANAVFQLNKVATCDNISITDSWLSGGISTINALDTGLTGVNLTLLRNRITAPLGTKNAVVNCASAAAVNLTASGNTYNGAPISLAVGDGRRNAA